MEFMIDYTDAAEERANETGIPHYVVWHDGYRVMPVTGYVAQDHGCVQAVRYPDGYVHPFSPKSVLDQGKPLW